MDFSGFSPRNCGEHRSVGSRAWCIDCNDWCTPHLPCVGCSRLPVDDLIYAITQARYKWGDQYHISPTAWLTILTEEVGEVAHIVCDHLTIAGDGDSSHYPEKYDEFANLRSEIAQVAAVCIRWMLAIDAEEDKRTTDGRF